LFYQFYIYIFEKGTKNNKKQNQIISSIIILCLFFFQKGNAQERISVDTSVELALQNNFKIKNEKLRSEYLQQ
jgi:hypothetical protein